MQIIALLVYQIILLALLPVIPIYLFIRALYSKEEFDKIYQRFGLINLKNITKDIIYIHVASVGEARSVFCLINEILDKNYHVHVSIMTKTGFSIVKNNFGNRENFTISYVPLDVPIFIILFFLKLRPKMALFVASEIWPNLVIFANIFTKNNVYLLNAILSKKSMKNWQYLEKFNINIFAKFKEIFVCEEQFISHIIKYNPNISYYGNMKSDYVAIQSNLFKNKSLQDFLPQDKKIILLASTHENEEELILSKLDRKYLTDKALIIAPRHPNRVQYIVNLIKNAGYNPIFLTEIATNNIQIKVYDVIIVDIIGEMTQCYDSANVIFIGGSLIDKIGGHNPLEPIFHKKPVIIGKYYANCTESVGNLEKYNCIKVIDNCSNIAEVFNEMIINSNKYLQNIEKFLANQNNATIKIINKIFG